MHVHLIRPAWGQGKHFHLFEGSPPLGLAYIAAALLDAAHRVTVTDAVIEGWDNIMPYGPMVARGLHNREVADRVPPDADAIGISVTSTTDWPLVVDLCARLSEARPGVPILLGGEHPSALPGLCLRTSCADVVVIGEGERTVVELIEALASEGALDDVDGIAFTRDGEVIETAPRARIRDLESIPRPAWQLFDIEGYQANHFVGGALWQGRRSLPMLASRGCPYACTFCTSPNMWAPLWLPRQPRDVVDEMEALMRDYDIRDFSLHDLTTVVRRQWVLDLCDEIIERNLEISWQLHSGTRLEEVDDELVDAMLRAGLTCIVLAPESNSAPSRERVNKRMVETDIERAIDATVDAGVPLKVQVMSGLPGDGHRDAWSNLRFAFHLGRRGVDSVGTAIFAPYPGTVLFDELLADGSIAFGEELIFFPVANNDFARPVIKGQALRPWMVKAYQLATLGTFVGAKSLFWPRRTASAVHHALRNDHERWFFEKLVKAIATTLSRLARSPCNGEPIPLPSIDYSAFDPSELQCRRRMTTERQAHV